MTLRRMMRGLMTRLRIARERFVVRDPVIHLYCLCWNEERMLPFFFRHYDPLVARYFVFDNGSTDRSIEMLSQHPKVTLGEFRTVGESVINEAPAFYETVWHRSRKQADWIFIVNIDELLYHPDGKDYFKRCMRRGQTVVPAVGYEMVSEDFPHRHANLPDHFTRGVRAIYMDKPCAFRPRAIRKIRYALGRHSANPVGYVAYPPVPELRLLHYKYLGEDYLIERSAELGARTPESDRKKRLGSKYFRSREQLIERHRSLMRKAKPVPGLVARHWHDDACVGHAAP
jgi:hypothetical protein